MKLLIDENIRKEVIDFLENSGFDVLRVPSGSSDAEIAKIAKEERRIILTHDRHFADIFAYPPKQFSGIIRLKIHPPRADIIIKALGNLFQKLSPSQIDKRLVVLKEDGFRIR